MDSTSQKIIDSAMCLVRDKGYVATTTKEIARKAGVNECTLFRKFESKKDIVLSGMKQLKWRADMSPELFKNVKWDLEQDLQMFMSVYMDKITPDFVKLSIGLRAPQIYEETAPMIMKVPQAFVSAITDYFYEMEKRRKINHTNYESLAMTVFSSAFGFTFLKASFNDELSSVQKDEYIKESVELFLKGLNQ